MGTVCKVGGRKEILGQWYRKVKQARFEFCAGCAFESVSGRPCPLPNSITETLKAIEDGGSECGYGRTGTIWARTDAPDTNAKPTPKKATAPKLHAWEPRTLEIGPKATKQILVDLVRESVDEINQLGTENATLRNQIAALRRKQKGTK